MILDRIVPDATLKRVTVGGTENRDGTAGLWTLKAYAICSVPPPGLQLVASPTSAPVAKNQGAYAACPVGKKLIGGGGELIGANGRIVMSRISPGDRLEGMGVTSLEDGDPTSIPWSVRAYAICAAPPAGLTLVSEHSDLLHPLDPNHATATCPVGTRLLGTGGAIVHHFLDDVGDALLEGHHLLGGITPGAGLTGVRVVGYDGQRAWGAFDAFASAICAKPPAGPVAPPPGEFELPGAVKPDPLHAGARH